MTFTDITRLMLNSMDFFELRRTAGRYGVAFQGVRRQKLIKDIEKRILEKSLQAKSKSKRGAVVAAGPVKSDLSVAASEAAVSARPDLKRESGKKVVARINTFSARHAISRIHHAPAGKS